MEPLDDDFNVVYWGGRGAAVAHAWSFQLSRRRDSTVFDEDLDTAVDIVKEKIRIFVDLWITQVNLNALVATEGTTISVERLSVDGTLTRSDFTFPERERPRKVVPMVPPPV